MGERLLKYWISIKYPMMSQLEDYSELDYSDMLEFSQWVVDNMHLMQLGELTKQ